MEQVRGWTRRKLGGWLPSQENPSKSTLLIRPNRRALRQTPWRGHPHHSNVTDGSHEASGGLDKSPGKGLAGWGQLHRTGRENSLAGRPGKPGSSLGRDPVRLWEKVQPSHPTGLCPGGPGRGCVLGARGEAVSQEGTPTVSVEPEEGGGGPGPGLPLSITNSIQAAPSLLQAL